MKKIFLFLLIACFTLTHSCAASKKDDEDSKPIADLPSPQRAGDDLHLEGKLNFKTVNIALSSGVDVLSVADRIIFVEMGSEHGCYHLWPADFEIGQVECLASGSKSTILAGHALYRCQAPGMEIRTFKRPYQGFSFSCEGEAKAFFYNFSEGVKDISLNTCADLKSKGLSALELGDFCGQDS